METLNMNLHLGLCVEVDTLTHLKDHGESKDQIRVLEVEQDSQPTTPESPYSPADIPLPNSPQSCNTEYCQFAQVLADEPESYVDPEEEEQQQKEQEQEQEQIDSPIPWIEENDDDSFEIVCCQDDSPYHLLTCEHLICSQSSTQGCGVNCVAAVERQDKKPGKRFRCDWCSDRECFEEMIDIIREYWGEAIAENKFLTFEHVKPIIDDFGNLLKAGRRAKGGRSARKAFARPDEDTVDRFEDQVVDLLILGCQHFLQMFTGTESEEDENSSDEDWEDIDDEEDEEDDFSEEVEDLDSEKTSLPLQDWQPSLALRVRPQATGEKLTTVEALKTVEAMLAILKLDDQFEDAEEAFEAEVEATELLCLPRLTKRKRTKTDGDNIRKKIECSR
jgi:hypothetical protein